MTSLDRRLADVDAVLFDLDGVLTPTAEVHERAWKEMFDGFLAGHAGQEPFTPLDYQRHVDGKARLDGVRGFVRSRGFDLDDTAVAELGDRKNRIVLELLQHEGVVPYEGSVRFLDAVEAAGLAVAVVSSSRNASLVLEAAGLADRFDVVVDGAVAAAEGLAGKPAPDTYVRGAELVGVLPARAVVVEDALSGVEAGAAGGFGLVIGVDRAGQADDLARAGADIVVADLADLLTRS